MIKSLVFLGILTYALSSMNVISTILYGITVPAVLVAIVGYIVGTYLFYYGIFVKEEPSLKEKMKEEKPHKGEKSKI